MKKIAHFLFMVALATPTMIFSHPGHSEVTTTSFAPLTFIALFATVFFLFKKKAIKKEN